MKILITGGTNGMGKGVARVLAGYPGERNELIILCRSKEAGFQTVEEIAKRTGNNSLSIITCDLADMSSVAKAVEEVRQKHDYLDGIFINAGIGYSAGRIETVDGMDSHFQVNYLSQFYLLLQLLELLEKSSRGGRVLFNATRGGRIYWDDIQMKNKWHYERAIHQAMTAKRMLLKEMHDLFKIKEKPISFVGFEISKTVWSNQINIIPTGMRIMALIMRIFGLFITIDQCGEIMAPLFVEDFEENYKRSGKLITWKKQRFMTIPEAAEVLDGDKRKKMYDYTVMMIGKCS
jgi:hypothetical protein